MTTPFGQDQSEVFAFLENPGTHRLADKVTRIDTHGAAVFLAGPDVYKIKRALRFPYMDFSTLEKRRVACEAEIAVNRDAAPEIYLGAMPIVREGGVLRLGGTGEIVEWAVHLRRFDENATLDHVAVKGPLGAELTDKLARTVAAAHRRAPIRDGAKAARALRQVLTETVGEFAETPHLFSPERAALLGSALVAAFDQVEPLLQERGGQGQVRHCHGDLHLRNVVLVEGMPILFDAIEFDEEIATSDVLYDLSFLIMDLCERHLRADANRLLNRYLGFCEAELLQIRGLAAFPLFLGLRAAIRAKVIATQLLLAPETADLRKEALAYFDVAVRFLETVPPQLVAIGGLSGTGKSTLAAAIAPSLGRAPGAVHLRSDVERKHMFGVADTQPLPSGAYESEVSVAVYATIHGLAEAGLRADQSMVVDATQQHSDEREAIAAVAARAGVPFFGFWLEAPTAALERRVSARRGDASDATAAVVAAQAKVQTGPMTWTRLDATQPVEMIARAILDEIHARGGTDFGVA